MSLLHHKAKEPALPEVETADAVAAADYDAAADLALPTAPGTSAGTDDGFVPFAGELVDQHTDPAYDVQRDTGITPS